MPEAALASLPINAGAEPDDNLPQTLASLMLNASSLIIVTVPNVHAAARVLSPLQARLAQTGLVLTLGKLEDVHDFFRQLATQLNIDHIGVPLASLSASVMGHIQNLHRGCVMLLCNDADAYDSALLEQIRQWDNLQLQHGHVSILLCGTAWFTPTYSRPLPPNPCPRSAHLLAGWRGGGWIACVTLGGRFPISCSAGLRRSGIEPAK